MKKSLLITVFASVSLLCSASIAQEASGAFAPAPKSFWSETDSDVQSQHTADEQRRIERAARRNEREKVRLYRIMEIEGSEFSQEKYDRYRLSKVFGVYFIVIGGASGFGIWGVVMATFFNDFGRGDDYDGYIDSEDRSLRNAAIILSSVTVAGCGIGIPLFLKGLKGKSRQSYLKRKQEILDATEPQLSMKLQLDPKKNFVGLGMNISF